ncbi:MAG: glycosyl hydrolase family 18 protein [Bacteroidales bacterium]|nr:glycosyl hydrolase family 18 protein [Bacteroidales bacterium]
MKNHLITALILLFVFAGCNRNVDIEPEKEKPYVPSERVAGRVAVAYVTYYGTQIPDPSVITHINYAFAELYVVDNVYQGFKLQGNQARFENVVNLKQNYPDLKILLSFSHTVSNSDNKQGGGFSAMSKTEEGRKAFAEDCLEFIHEWNIDGIDIDWEFPGLSWSGHACDPAADVQNHVLLMKQLRETLGSEYLLTYAGYIMDKRAISTGYRYIDIAAVDPYVDFVNLMTYDMDEKPNHHSALRSASAYWDCQRAVNAYIAAGVATEKIVLGIPFYGRRSFSKSPTSVSYKNILKLDKTIYKIDNWDGGASVPYVTTIADNSFYCGYDNSESIAIKGAWALNLGMKGLMYWEYDSDDASGTLRKAIWEAVMKK